jgi:hypothetical protein
VTQQRACSDCDQHPEGEVGDNFFQLMWFWLAFS